MLANEHNLPLQLSYNMIRKFHITVPWGATYELRKAFRERQKGENDVELLHN